MSENEENQWEQEGLGSRRAVNLELNIWKLVAYLCDKAMGQNDIPHEHM